MENKKYIIYIDESGILSKKGHSIYVCLCIENIHKYYIDQKIINLEKELKISYLHWVDMPWKFRFKFAEKIKNLEFISKIVIYKNPINQKNILKDFLSKVISNNDNISEIYIDGNKNRRLQTELKTFLRQNGIKVYKIKFVDDKDESLIRLADFIAGMYRSFLDNKNNDNIYIYNLLKYKIKIPN